MTSTYAVPERVKAHSQQPIKDLAAYHQTCHEWRNDPNAFWIGETQAHIHWRKAPTVGLEGDYHAVTETPFSWFRDGRLNVTESCLDRHANTQPDKIAIIWEGDEPGDVRRLSYAELRDAVCEV